MQALDPLGAYSDAEVLAALQGLSGSRTLTYRFDRLDATNELVGPIARVLAGSVSYNSLADIHRTAKFTIADAEVLDYLSDRIKPWVQLRMPDGGMVEWPQGVFVLSTPTRTLSGGTIAREVAGYDLLQVLGDTSFINRITVPKDYAYVDAIEELLSLAPSITSTAITDSPLELAADKEWEPGTSILAMVNDLLSAINYVPAHFDENGTFIAKPYETAAERDPEYAFASDAVSILSGDVSETIDLFSIPNRWIVVKSDPDGDELVGTYSNDDPDSVTSSVSRGRYIVDVRSETEAADQYTITKKAERIGYEASQVFQVVEFGTAALPIMGHADVYTIGLPELGLDPVKFVGHTWELELVAGAIMKHKARRVVTL